MTQPDADTTEPDGWDGWYWPEQEISAPSRIEYCPLCGALVADWSGRELHVAWHRTRGEAPERRR